MMGALLTLFGVVVGGLILIPIITISITCYMGWALMTMWGWYMVPLGIQEIGFVHACGLSLLIGLFNIGRVPMVKNEENKDLISRTIGLLLSPLLITGVGFLFKGWMPA